MQIRKNEGLACLLPHITNKPLRSHATLHASRSGFFYSYTMRNRITYECTDKSAPAELVEACPKNETYISPMFCKECFDSIPVADDGVFTAMLYIDGTLYKTIRTNF